MKFGTGSNTELTQNYERVNVQNDIRSPNIYIIYIVMCLSTCIEQACLVRLHKMYGVLMHKWQGTCLDRFHNTTILLNGVVYLRSFLHGQKWILLYSS